MCAAMKRLLERGQGQPLAVMRKQTEQLGAYGKNLKNVNFQEVKIAGINCLSVSPKANLDSRRIVVYLHGGGYVTGSPKGYQSLICDIAVSAGCDVIAPDYRLAPEAPFPAPQDDCLAMVKQCLRRYADKKVIIAGDSAGGGLAIAAVLSLAEESLAPHSLVLISPWVDPTKEDGSMITNADHDFLTAPFAKKSFEALMQGQDAKNSRVNFSEIDLSVLPKSLIQYGSAELFYDQISEFSDRAKAQGVPLTVECYPDQCHDFQLFTPVSQTARTAIQRIGQFIRES